MGNTLTPHMDHALSCGAPMIQPRTVYNPQLTNHTFHNEPGSSHATPCLPPVLGQCCPIPFTLPQKFHASIITLCRFQDCLAGGGGGKVNGQLKTWWSFVELEGHPGPILYGLADGRGRSEVLMGSPQIRGTLSIPEGGPDGMARGGTVNRRRTKITKERELPYS